MEKENFSKSSSSDENKLKERTLKLSVKEGCGAAVMSGAGESYITPFALALNASNAQIGFLSSFVSLFGSFSQIIGSKLAYRFKRKQLVLVAVFLQATMWIFLLLLGFLYWKGIISFYAATLLIIVYSTYALFGNLAGPAWFSMMGDLTQKESRGKYFSKRNRVVGFVAMIVTLGSAFFLDHFENSGKLILGFIFLFTLASIGRYVSFLFFTRHYDPPFQVKKESYFSLWQFIKKAPSNNFGRFVIYVGLINLATNFASPFFNVYMLKELNFSYTWFTIVNISASLFTLMTLPLWGKLGDKFGNRSLLKFGAFLIPLVPLPWLISGNPIFLIFSAQFFSGIAWGAFNLAASNYIYDAVTPERRAVCVAYFNFLNGIGLFAGAFIGGLFAEYINVGFMSIFLLIFLISALLRALVSVIFIPLIKEVKEIPKDNVSVINYILMGTPRPFYNVFRGVNTIISNAFFRVSEK